LKKPKLKFVGDCYGCGEKGHKSIDCPKEKSGQNGSKKDKKNKDKKSESVVAVANEQEDLFTFTCMSDFAMITKAHGITKTDMGPITDTGASRHYCPDKEKFINYCPISNAGITMADGCHFKATGEGDLLITLPNGNENTKCVLKKAIHAPDFSFMLILISCLDQAGCSATFANSACTIWNHDGKVKAILPRAQGLY
jgi:hypothetical protein